MKLIILSLLLFIALGMGAFFILFPGFVDRRMNRIIPRAASAVSSRALELHQKLWIADLHCDALLWNRDLTQRHKQGIIDIPRLIDGNIALQVFTSVTMVPYGINFEKNEDKNDILTLLAIAQRWPMPTWTSRRARALYQARRLREYAARSNGQFTLITSRSDLRSYNRERERNPKMTAGLLGIEGAQALEGEPGNLIPLFDAGFRLLGLTHFCDNEMAGSAQGMQKGGLTVKGRQVVQLMQQLGMIIDLAHASEQTIDDVLALVEKSVMVSHTGVRGTCNRNRNLSDEHLRGVAATGGVIGIAFFEEALCETSVDAVVKAIEHTAQVAGIEHVALGSDWDGGIQAVIGPDGLVELTDALLRAGFSGSEIAMILGGNVQRMLLEVLPE